MNLIVFKSKREDSCAMINLAKIIAIYACRDGTTAAKLEGHADSNAVAIGASFDDVIAGLAKSGINIIDCRDLPFVAEKEESSDINDFLNALKAAVRTGDLKGGVATFEMTKPDAPEAPKADHEAPTIS